VLHLHHRTFHLYAQKPQLGFNLEHRQHPADRAFSIARAFVFALGIDLGNRHGIFLASLIYLALWISLESLNAYEDMGSFGEIVATRLLPLGKRVRLLAEASYRLVCIGHVRFFAAWNIRLGTGLFGIGRHRGTMRHRMPMALDRYDWLAWRGRMVSSAVRRGGHDTNAIDDRESLAMACLGNPNRIGPGDWLEASIA
jgi:hypothetical protein